jgi:hypothetical protein
MRCRSANDRTSGNFAFIVHKMFTPVIQSRMKQPRHFPCFGIKAGKVRSFVQIAVMTGQRKILGNIFTAMLSRDDMFNVERQKFLFLSHPAILTNIFCALPDELAQLRFHLARFGKNTPGFSLKNSDKRAGLYVSLIFSAFPGGQFPFAAFLCQFFHAHLCPSVHTQRRQCPRRLDPQTAADRLKHFVQNCATISVLHIIKLTDLADGSSRDCQFYLHREHLNFRWFWLNHY